MHDNERIGADLGVIADGYRSQECGAGPDDDIISNGRMPFASMFACSAERNVMEHHAVVAYFHCLPDNHARPVINKEVLSNPGSRMNFHTGPETCNHGQQPWNDRKTKPCVKELRNPVEPDPLLRGVALHSVIVSLLRWSSSQY